MSAKETSFETLDDVPVHYDRLPAHPYGSEGVARKFDCRKKLKDTLNVCFHELFDLWGQGKPRIILTAGTIGDGENAHGKGYAFDLDGFYFQGADKFMMDRFKDRKELYIGINAHLFLYFSQVLNFYYPNHADHFHVDFNFSFTFRPSSNAQTFFLQAALVHVYQRDLEKHGEHKDGVDGIYAGLTKSATESVLKDLGLSGQGGLTKAPVWKEFLIKTRQRAFESA
jgi:hypothetical protein